MKNKVITITTDFGDSFATSQLRAVLATLGFNGTVIENHDVKSYSIIEGAYGIWQTAKYCPKGTIHVGVIDLGVGSPRLGIIIKTNNFWFVAPDNGLLYPAAKKDGIKEIWKIDNSAFKNCSSTFEGRDIFIKVAAFLASGKKPEDFGSTEIDSKDLAKLEFQNGQVVHIDKYGNIKIWGNKTFGLPLVKTFSDVKVGQPLILRGSSDVLEICLNQKSAEEHFGVKLEQVLEKL